MEGLYYQSRLFEDFVCAQILDFINKSRAKDPDAFWDIRGISNFKGPLVQEAVDLFLS